MKSIVNRMIGFVLIAALTGVVALAKSTEREVTFTKNLTVNGTLVKKGTYKVEFNEETNELTIKKGKKVVATAQARLEKIEDRYTFYTSSEENDPAKAPALVNVSFKDGNLATIVGANDNRATSSRQ
jgi:carboxypeptidase C (cathepsin A)